MTRAFACALAVLVAMGTAACGILIGAEWDGTLRGEAPSGSDAPNEDERGGGSDAARDTETTEPCDACAPTTATAIAAGADHSCAIVEDGIVCWGQGLFGQLGAGAGKLNPSTIPQRVFGITKATAIAAGYAHTCAIVEGGDVTCWGWSKYGQLGNGSTSPEEVPVPVRVTGLPAAASAIAASWGHTCAALVTGALYCWGNNEFGQLGTGTPSPTLAPALVTGLGAGVSAVVAGIRQSCAIVSGAAQCWGAAGQLGNGTLNASASPVAVFGVASGAESIATGTTFSCVTVNGAVSCWGFSTEGALGDPPKTMALKPNPVPGVQAGATAVSAGDHACAIVAGGVRCWGPYPGNGSPMSDVASIVSGPPGVSASALASGQRHACAIVAGAVWCWGSNISDQLGISGVAESLEPVRVGN